MSRFQKVFLIFSVLAMFAGIGFLVFKCVTVPAEDARAAAELDDAEDALDQTNAKLDTVKTDLVKKSSGISDERTQADARALDQLVNDVYNWSDSETYRKNRDDLIEMGISEDSQLLYTFMSPEVEHVGDDGSTFSEIDVNGYHSELVSFTPYLLSIENGTDYEYLCVVESKSSDSNGAEMSGESVVLVTLNEDGAVLDARGYASV